MTISRATGDERFRDGDADLGFDLLSFWRWSASDIVSNVMRGRLAEYLVARAMGLGEADIREEWSSYDIHSPEAIKIEVKSFAYVQRWAQSKPSVAQFRYGKTKAWDAHTNLVDPEAKRHADVYVFALLHHQDQATLDPLDVAQWRFYVAPTCVIDSGQRSQYSITLGSLETFAGPGVEYSELRAEVIKAFAIHQKSACIRFDP
jgi:hypothetical protein